MKKFLAALSTALLIVVLALTLSGCDNSGKIQKAFEKEGYEVTVTKADEDSTLLSMLDDEQKKDISQYSIITCKKGLHVASIIKFPSANTIKESVGESDYDKLVESGFVNGNCYLVFTIDTEVIGIFKNA